jgi:O-antigen ligase
VQLAALALVALAMAEAVLDHGGFSTASQVVFVLLAGAAAGCAVRRAGRTQGRNALSHPLVVVLLALAALSALSSLWTAGLPDEALTAALLPAGYALLAAAVLAAGASASDRALVRRVVLLILCVCAFAGGVVGLIAVATFSEPGAFSPNGVWRPAGTLEYTAALTLLQVCALPALLRALAAGGRIAALASAPATVAGAVLGLSASRLGLAMALAVAVAAIAAPQLTVRATRARAFVPILFVALAAAVARAALGGAVAVGADPAGWRLAVAIGLFTGAPVVWIALEAGAQRSVRAAIAFGAAALIACAAVSPVADSAAATNRAAFAHGERRARADPGDVLHGRGNIWSAGVRAFARRPLQGYGAAAFGDATLELQHPAITGYAHDLPLELGVELGLLGAALGLALYVVVARACWRARAIADAWPLLVPAAAFLVANLVDWPWHIAGIGAVWAAAAGALVVTAARSDTVARS